MNLAPQTPQVLGELKAALQSMARRRGFDALGVSDVELSTDAARLERWLAAGRQGEMDYMWKHGSRRTQPGELVPGTVRVRSARMNYFPADGASGTRDAFEVLGEPESAYISR